MPRRDTMHLRSSRVFLAALLLSSLTPTAAPQQSSSGDAFPSGVPSQASAPQQEPAKPDSTQSKPAPQQETPQGQGQDEQGFVFHKQVEEVVLHATVVDDKQRLVTNLEKQSFTVLEDGRPQRITSFRLEDIPVALAIVIDNSGSMREKRRSVNAAALNLVRASNPQDQVCVVNFNDAYYLDQDYTGNVDLLQDALERIEARGGTALYDAL